jgi:molybdopterin-guanine dinucleotide biosynthesis protein A
MNTFIEDCSAAILAGGENRRMPVLKAFIEVNGQKIIEKNLGIMNSLFEETFIVTNQPSAYSYLGAKMFGDIYDIRGPMTGILTSLLNSSGKWVYISACDMPFINTDLIKYMASRRKGVDAVVPVLKGKPEPLFSLYSKRLLTSMEKAVLSDNKSLKDFLGGKRVQYITTGEIKKFDPEAVSFINLNTPRDIDLYLKRKDILRFKQKQRGG